MTSRYYGKVVHYNAEKGYGFILLDQPYEDQKTVFFHCSKLSNNLPSSKIKKGLVVGFEVIGGSEGFAAIDVDILNNQD